jgi:hypothetical protein
MIPMRRMLADVVSTALIVNLAIAYISGGIRLPLAGLSTPSFRVSLLLAVAWFGGRLAMARWRQTMPAAAAAWVRSHLPEVLVAGLVAIGLTMRLTGIGFGRPLVLHPDEHQVVGVSIFMLKSGWIAPPVPYHYPTVFPYLLLPGFALLYVKGKSAGLWSGLDDIQTETFEFYELARGYSAMLGTLTIVVTFVLATRLWPGRRGRWTGVMAATYLTFALNHVKESHHGVTDAALTFFVALAFLAIVSAFRRGSTGAYALAGFAAGIACATKYSALPVVAVLVAAHVFDRSGRWSAWRRLAVGLAAVPVGFFTGYPYALLNWPPFLEHLGWMSGYSGARAFDAGQRLDDIVRYAMESGLGLLFTLTLGVAGVAAIYRRRVEEGLALVFIVVALALLANTAFPFYARYLLPMMPAAALIVASFLADVWGWTTGPEGSRRRLAASAAAVTALLVLVWPQARESVEYLRHVRSPDTRVQALHHVIANLPAGSTIASEDAYLTLPPEYELIRWTPIHDVDPAEIDARQVDALILSADQAPDAGSDAGRARREIERRFPIQATFAAGVGGHVGPTLTLHVRPGR